MSSQKKWEELFNWANEDEENRKKAIFMASQFIAILNNSSGQKLSKEEIHKIVGGKGFGSEYGANPLF